MPALLLRHRMRCICHLIFLRGSVLWNDSIDPTWRREARHKSQGDTGEELHAMDYLVYAYLQSGREQDAAQVIQQLKAMKNLRAGDFKIGYAATAMPIRYIVERQQWDDAESVVNPPDTAQPHVVAIAVWARGLGFARSGHSRDADKESDTLRQIENQLHASGNNYWETQVDIMRREVMAWSAQSKTQSKEAAAALASAADDEDGIEKLPVTPGPIVPAREQLGELLLEQGDSSAASKAFQTALVNSPGRRRAVQGAAKTAHAL